MDEIAASSPLRVALLPWGDVIEDFLFGIGVTVDAFCDEMSGGWLFGYVDALARFEVETVIVCFSRGVDAPTCRVHAPTGAPIWLLPAPRLHRAARRVERRLVRTARVPPPVQSAAELGRMYSATSVRALM